jgi:hypothetical protein
VQPHFDDLVVSTYGRGFWILDDVTPLQQLGDVDLADPAHLFEPRVAYRFLRRESPSSQPGDPAAGENPAYGATLNFHLGRVPDGPVSVTVEDERGEVIRELPVRDARRGLNRVVWDLTYTPSRRPRLRTPALRHAHVAPGESGWRPAPDGGTIRPLATPGRYRVRLSVGSEERTAWLTVLPDPQSNGTADDMAAQLAMMLELREMTDSTSALIERIEWARKGLGDLNARLSEAVEMRDLIEAAEALEAALVELEMRLFDLRLSGGLAGQDTIRWPRRLFAKLTSLAGYVSGSDARPTDQANEVLDLYRDQLRAVLARWSELAESDLARFNRQLAERGLAPIVSDAP